MVDGAHGEGDSGSRQSDEAALSARLRRLGERLDAAEAGRAPPVGPGDRATVDTSAFARGFRLSTEFVAGVLVGAGLGWLVDHWLKTSPWGLIVLTLLGFAAGVASLVRTSSRGSGSASNGRTPRRPD